MELHYVEAGDGPLVLLLHGFPEFWYGWRKQIEPLVDAGFRVVAPDLRGYNLSSKPDGYAAYTADKLADDVRGLIRELGAESAMVVGHDWGGTVAWTLAMNHPQVVDRLAILNAAHPRRLNEGLRNPRQLLRSWYFFYFQFPRLPERRARRRHWRFFKRFLRDARPPYTAEELERYVEAWSQPGAATAMIDYYRAAVRLGSKQELRRDLGAHPGHLGAGRSLPRPRARRAARRGRAQPRPRRAPAQRVPLGPPRRGRARERTARRLPRTGRREREQQRVTRIATASSRGRRKACICRPFRCTGIDALVRRDATGELPRDPPPVHLTATRPTRRLPRALEEGVVSPCPKQYVPTRESCACARPIRPSSVAGPWRHARTSRSRGRWDAVVVSARGQRREPPMTAESRVRGPGGRLRGRASECALLDDLVSAIRRGESRSLVLRGEAGIGKTALLEYLIASAPDATVVRAVGVQSDMELAFASLHQLCGPLLDRLETLPAPQRQAMEIVFGLDRRRGPGSVPRRVGGVESVLGGGRAASAAVCGR